MNILEIEYTGDSMPQGVVLCLVGKEGEETRSLRMHNLASLISLAKWAVAHQVSVSTRAIFFLFSLHQGRRSIAIRSTFRVESTTRLAETQEQSVGQLRSKHPVSYR